MRELRNQGGKFVDRVLAGEHFLVTRDGIPVAELRPIAETTTKELQERRRGLPPMDTVAFRADIDAFIDQSLE